MSELAPDAIDVMEIQFKRQCKVKIFNANATDLNNVSFLASASSQGLVFCGTTGNEIKAIQLSSITSEDFDENAVPARTFRLPGQIKQIAVSCDDSMLAVDVIKNGVPFLQIYAVQSFYSSDVVLLNEIPVPGPNHERTLSLLWNPVQNNVLAVVTENGELIIFTLKQPGFEMCKYDGGEQVQSACWSPKGKQIVAGFANGKLVQFKPDLKPAKQIPCPNGVIDGEFNVIALQWLATYQFAAVFQSKSEDTTPALYIINAPKTGNTTYINYDDITYGNVGPRKAQVFLIHIIQWNLLIVASANSVEVALLGSDGVGDCPQWKQYCPSDFRADLPLNEAREETYPIGMALETGCTHQVLIKEKQYPVSPMVHLLSTDGYLISFNLLNTLPNTPDICSPPAPVSNRAGLSKFIVQDLQSTQQQTGQLSTPPSTPPPAKQAEFSFNPSNTFASSTPAAKVNPTANTGFGLNKVNQPAFGAPASLPTGGSLFGGLGKSSPFGGEKTQAAPSFGSLTGSNMTFNKPPPPAQQPLTQVQPQPTQQTITKPQPLKTDPLITVPTSFKPPPPVTNVQKPDTTQASRGNTDTASLPEDVRVVVHMIRDEINTFNRDLQELQKRSKATNFNIGSKEEQQQLAKSLNELQKFTNEAVEANESLSSDLRSLRLGLNETFAMVAEARKKNLAAKGEANFDIPLSMSIHQTSKRQLEALERSLLVNESQLEIILRQLDAQWCEYEDAVKQRNRTAMKIPGLENVYQTLSKQKDILAQNKIKIANINARLGLRDTIQSLKLSKSDATIESLTDSIISMTIIDQVRAETSKLTPRKTQKLREALKGQKIEVVKPRRPDRPDINSEIVREKRESVRRIIRVTPTEASPKVTPKPPTTTKQVTKPVATQPQAAPVTISKPVTQLPTQQLPKPTPVTTTVEQQKINFNQPPKYEPIKVQSPVVSKPATPTVTKTPTTVLQSTISVKPTTTLFGTTTITAVPKAASNENAEKPSPKPMTELPKPNFSFGLSTSEKSTELSTKFFEKVTDSDNNTNKENDKEKNQVKAPLEGLMNLVSKNTELSSSVSNTTAAPFAAPKSSVPVFSTSSFNFGKSENSLNNGNVFGQATANKQPTPAPNPVVTTSATPSIFGGASIQSSGANTGFSFSTVASSPSFWPTPSQAPSSTAISTPPTATKPFGSIQTTPVTSTATVAPKPAEQTPIQKPEKSAEEPKTPENAVQASSAFNVTPASSTFSFGNTSSASPFGVSTVKSTASTATTPQSNLFTKPLFGGAENTPTSTVQTTPKPAEKPTPDGLFSSFNICSPSTPTTPATGNASNIFGQNTTFGGTQGGTPSTSIFGKSAPTATDKPSVFGGAATVASTSASPFSSFANNASFATPAASSPFSSVTTTTTTGSIFGAQVSSSPSGFTATSVSSPFGNANQPQQSIFGGASPAAPATNTPASAPLFGSVTSSGGFPKPEQNVFGGNTTFGSNTTSVFGAPKIPSPTTAAPFGATSPPSAFGGGSSSLFGQSSTFGQSSSPSTGGSIFGGGANNNAAPSAFGGSSTQAPAFGSQPTFGSGFTSGISAFAKPTFGGGPTFGGAPVFGSPPQPTAVVNPNQSNNLFAQLGSTDTGMSFGSLAQTSSPPQQQQQPNPPPAQFGGSAFSSWR